jgi:hypothetical protein
MNKLPFNFTPQIFRYLEEIIRINNEELAEENDNPIIIDSYVYPEQATIRAEANNSSFWSYLEKLGAIKQYKISVGDEVEVERIERTINEKSDFIYFPKHQFKILDAQKIEEIFQGRNHFILNPKTLELIAREIKEVDSASHLITYLKECGVNDEIIYYPNTKWKMIYAVFRILATSQDPADHDVLFKIIEDITHPLTHNGDEQIAKNYQDKFNRLLKYDGYTLANNKIKKDSQESDDMDLSLYIQKKILVDKWRDDYPYSFKELSFSNNSLEQICFSLWNLFASDDIALGANTYPENIMIEANLAYEKTLIFNWDLVRSLDSNPYKIDDKYGFEIEILNEKKIKEEIKNEIKEFISNKADEQKLKMAQEDLAIDTAYYETPSYLRGVAYNYYSYKKQRRILLRLIANLYNQFENETLVIKFGQIKDKSLNILRTMLALESEGFFTIKELGNAKKEWADTDNIFIKIQIDKADIPIIKQFQLPKKIDKPVEANIDFTDTASRKAWEKKWDVLQAIWTTYNGNSQPDNLLVRASVLLIKDRNDTELTGILDGLKREGCFDNWEREEDYFNIQKINHNKFIETYKNTGLIYDKFAKVYQERIANNQKKEPTRVIIENPLTIQGITEELKIKGLEEKVILQKPRNKRIHLRNFPKDLRWEEITIQFLNGQEVILTFRSDTNKKDTKHTTYKEMGFEDERKKQPNKQWEFLKGLSETNGELSWANNRNLTTRQINSAKKQKQLLAETLKYCFQIQDDPFGVYRKEKAYRLKIHLMPENSSEASVIVSKIDEEKEDDKYGIKESYNEQTQSPE